VNAIALAASVGLCPVLAAASAGGAAGLAARVRATLVFDVAMQCGMVANVARFYAVRPGACNRMTSGYMTCAYLGGSAGSLLAAIAYAAAGWHAVAARARAGAGARLPPAARGGGRARRRMTPNRTALVVAVSHCA
jgi:hypothetical protein